jgi:hypothetical protein
MDWTVFYGAGAGASATLLGLLFVAIQLNMDQITGDRRSRWRALARSTFDHYTSLFILSVLMLIPGAMALLFGIVVFWMGVVSIGRLLWAWVPVWRNVFAQGEGGFFELVWLVLTPLGAYAGMLLFGYQAMTRGADPQLELNVAFCLVALFAAVLRNSWKLTVELVEEKKNT